MRFYGHKRIEEREGGVEVVLSELVPRLVQKGYEVDVYNRKGKNVLDCDAKAKNIKEFHGAKVINVPTINKKGLEAMIYSVLASLRIAFSKYDCVHYHAEGSCAMLWLPKLFHKRIVVTIHGLDWQRAKWGGFATRYIKFGEKMAAKYADEIIVLSKGVQEYFKETYQRDTHFIPNGVSQPELKEPQMIQEKYGLDKEDYILFLARIVPEKGLDYLIDAYTQIETDKKLVIAGGASHTNEYYQQIATKVKGNSKIVMTGFVQGQELEELYSNCYLYCLPSDIEGMPISLLEAMSYGRNCLVSDIEENRQVCGEYATVFEKSNRESLKQKLEQCLAGKNRYDAEEISKFVLEKFDWDEVVERTERLYKKGMME